MKIDKPLLQKIAHLAQLEITEPDTSAVLEDLNKIISWMEKLETLDTTSVEPITTMAPAYNNFREDIPQPPLPHENGLRNAPSKVENYFSVPQVKD